MLPKLDLDNTTGSEHPAITCLTDVVKTESATCYLAQNICDRTASNWPQDSSVWFCTGGAVQSRLTAVTPDKEIEIFHLS